MAHLGYFRKAFVERRRWLSEEAYAALVALAQALPGPTSSQVGMAIGYLRGGPWGALLAWLAFTFPSALLLFLAALALEALPPPPGLLQGLRLLALVVVAQAVGEMMGRLAPKGAPLAIALGVAILVTLNPAWQIPALLGAALLGLLLPGPEGAPSLAGLKAPPKALGLGALGLFLGLFLVLHLLAPHHPLFAFLYALYRAGSLILGGGHVVLPLLERALVPRFLDPGSFLAGYGLAQAVPGPLFSLAAYLGAKAPLGLPAWAGAFLGLLALFLPGALLLFAALPFALLTQSPPFRRALAGAGAGVVGLLLAALYDPLFRHGVDGHQAFALALGLYGLLRLGLPPWALAVLGATLGGAFL
ncbi:chromate transporter [Thermus composti]|nr:chromate transporter [Thermus composti]